MKKTASFFLFLIFLFAADNPVSAALPSNELWREGLINNVVGFGKNTIGGKGGTLCQVTNLNDSGAGSLRACAEAVGPMWITFAVSGTITLQSEIYIKSYKTIDGRGQNIIIANRGFIIGTWNTDTGPVSDVIVHNISMKNINGSGMIRVGQNASNVWIDHNTFQNAADEILYAGSGSPWVRPAPHNITISWNHFPPTTPNQGWADKVLLVSDPGASWDADVTITLHHNHYEGTYNRHPLARWAKIHGFNNYFNKNIQGVDARTNVQYYSENEIFEKNNSGVAVMLKAITGDPVWEPEGALNAKAVNPWLINGATVEQVNPSAIFNPSSYYAYTAETANSALQAKIIGNAGRQNVTGPTSLEAPTNLAVK